MERLLVSLVLSLAFAPLIALAVFLDWKFQLVPYPSGWWFVGEGFAAFAVVLVHVFVFWTREEDEGGR